MLAKASFINSLVLRNAAVMSRAMYHGGGHHKASTMNDLPVPQGDWQEDNARRNAKYNAWLVSGVVMLAGVIGIVKSTDIIHFNFSPPKSID